MTAYFIHCEDVQHLVGDGGRKPSRYQARVVCPRAQKRPVTDSLSHHRRILSGSPADKDDRAFLKPTAPTVHTIVIAMTAIVLLQNTYLINSGCMFLKLARFVLK